MRTYNREALNDVGFQICHLYPREQAHDIRGQSIRIDDLSKSKYLLQETYSTNQS